jgi:hypothetical protein
MKDMAPKKFGVHYNIITAHTKIKYLGGLHWHTVHAVFNEILPFGSKHEVEGNTRELGDHSSLLCSFLGRKAEYIDKN